MMKRNRKPATAAEAVRQAIAHEVAARPDLKPIEIVKASVCAYQAYYYGIEQRIEKPGAASDLANPCMATAQTVGLDAGAARVGADAAANGFVASLDALNKNNAAVRAGAIIGAALIISPIGRAGLNRTDRLTGSANASLTRQHTMVESDDRTAFRRGTQAAIDRALFNVN